jgi:hypothetical protein
VTYRIHTNFHLAAGVFGRGVRVPTLFVTAILQAQEEKQGAGEYKICKPGFHFSEFGLCSNN